VPVPESGAVTAHHDHVPGGAEIRLQVGDRFTGGGVAERQREVAGSGDVRLTAQLDSQAERQKRPCDDSYSLNDRGGVPRATTEEELTC
jgi:hypothetical protein